MGKRAHRSVASGLFHRSSTAAPNGHSASIG